MKGTNISCVAGATSAAVRLIMDTYNKSVKEEAGLNQPLNFTALLGSMTCKEEQTYKH